MNKSTVISKATPDKPAWWLKPQAELATMRQAYPVQRAHSRLSKFGPNLFRDHQERSLFLQFLIPLQNF
jgi:Mg2+-importing ATPase